MRRYFVKTEFRKNDEGYDIVFLHWSKHPQKSDITPLISTPLFVDKRDIEKWGKEECIKNIAELSAAVFNMILEKVEKFEDKAERKEKKQRV